MRNSISKLSRVLHLLLLLAACRQVTFTVAQEPPKSLYKDLGSVQVSLIVVKSQLRPKQTVKMLIYIENKSELPLYIGKNIASGFSGNSYHSLYLEIRDRFGKPILMGAGVEHPASWSEGVSVAEKLSKEYFLLCSGCIYGYKTKISINRLKPGTYFLRAFYVEGEADHWSDASLQTIKYPVYIGEAGSNRVKIVIK
jgi:hypothetical protein